MTRDVSIRRLQEVAVPPERNSAAVPGITSVRLHLICVVQALLAACVFTVTEHDDHHHGFWCTFEIAMQSLVVVAATVFIRTIPKRERRQRQKTLRCSPEHGDSDHVMTQRRTNL